MKPHTSLSDWQRLALSMMGSLIVLTFLMSNLYGQWWQMSDWLVAAVLPSVVVDLTNDERGDEALTSLRRNPLLDAAATKKAEHMAKYGYFAHYAPDGTTPWEFFDAVGYVYAHAGENLAVHFNDSSALVAAWMRSPSHRENIVNSQFSEIGVGTARGRYQGHETVFVVQLFGAPAAPIAPPEPVPPVVAVAPVTVPVNVSELNEPLDTASSAVLESPDAAPAAPVVAAAQSDATVPTPDDLPEDISLETALPATPQQPILLESTTESTLVAEEVVEIQEAEGLVEAEPSLTSQLELIPDEVALAESKSSFLFISSGLPAIPVAYADESTSGTTAAALATQPSRLLQVVYTALSLLVVWLLVTSALRDIRRQQIVRVGYSALMLLLMGGLVYLHVHLTSVVVIA